MESARRLLQISATNWLQACVAAVIAAFVLILVAEVIGAILVLMAALSLLFAAAAFIKSMFSNKKMSEKTGEGGGE